MAEEMNKLKAEKGKSSSSGNPYQTPPPTVHAPSPDPKAVVPAPKRLVKVPPPELAPPATEGARLQRLRRLCEKKPSGRCSVPEQIHLKWKNGSKEEREKLMDELEAAGWSKERVVQLMISISPQKHIDSFLGVLGDCFPLIFNRARRFSSQGSPKL